MSEFEPRYQHHETSHRTVHKLAAPGMEAAVDMLAQGVPAPTIIAVHCYLLGAVLTMMDAVIDQDEPFLGLDEPFRAGYRDVRMVKCN